MESRWNGPWNPWNPVHGMNMDSILDLLNFLIKSHFIWNGMDSPHGIHGLFHGIHMEWDFIKKFTKSNMESMFIP